MHSVDKKYYLTWYDKYSCLLCRSKHHFCQNRKVQVIPAILIHMKKSLCTFLHRKSVQRSLQTFRMQHVDKKYTCNVIFETFYFNSSLLVGILCIFIQLYASSICTCICIVSVCLMRSGDRPMTSYKSWHLFLSCRNVAYKLTYFVV